MIPVNGHIQVEPLKQEDFISSGTQKYQEIGIVIHVGDFFRGKEIKVGDKVYFDSWKAAKYPTGKGDDDFYWLVPWSDVRGYESLSK